MHVRPLAIEGAWEFVPQLHSDPRGVFLEVFAESTFSDAIGRSFELRQMNTSVSSAGVVRGIHFADVPPGQAKYVTCLYGAVLDVVVDLRVGSPTFGQWEAVLLDDTSRHAVYLAEGLGHAFMSLQDGSVVSYLCTQPYAPGREHGVDPLDPAIGIAWPRTGRAGQRLSQRLSDKDAAAPSLAAALEAGLLPSYDVSSIPPPH